MAGSVDEQLRQITSFHYDSRMSAHEAEQWLRSQPPQTAVPIRSQYQQLVLLWTGDKVERIDVSQQDVNRFINLSDLGNIEDHLAKYLEKYPQLQSVRQYTLQVRSAGEQFIIPQQDGVAWFTVTDKKNGEYFDFVVYEMDEACRKFRSCITYGQKGGTGYTHSGDIGALCHIVSTNQYLQEGQVLVLGECGYNKKKLVQFVEQQPFISVANHESQTINSIPCPLDTATLGDATLAGLVVMKLVNRVWQFYILPRPVAVDNVNTGDVSDTTLQACLAAIDQANTAWSNPPQPVAVQVVAATPSIQPTSGEKGPTQNFKHCVEFGVDSVFDLGQKVRFGDGFALENREQPVNLPHVFGPVGGTFVTLLGSLPTVNVYVETFPVVEVSTQWLDSVVQTCSTRMSGIFVVHAKFKNEVLANFAQVPTSANKIHLRTVCDQALGTVCTNAFCMAGPNSICLVAVAGELYWYRGVRVPGLIDKLPSFGDRVTAQFDVNALKLFYDSTVELEWPSFVAKGDQKLWWNGSQVEAEAFVTELANSDIETLHTKQLDIIDVLTQMSVLLSPEQTTTIRTGLVKLLSKLVEDDLRPLRLENMRKLEQEFNGQAVITQQAADDQLKQRQARMQQFKEAMKSSRAKVQKLVNAVEGLVSGQGSSNRNQSLKRIERATAIANNVQLAKTATLEEKMDMLSQICDEYGMVIVDVAPNKQVAWQKALQSISDGSFLTLLGTEAEMSQMLVRNGRMSLLDVDSCGALLFHSSAIAGHFLHGSNTSVAMPQGMTYQLQQHSSVPMPLVTKFVDTPPQLIDWVAETKSDSANNIYRIMLRNTIADATVSRQYNIQPQNKHLGQFLVHGILSVIESIIESIHDPTAVGYDSTNSQIIRGLLGQVLSIMASGNTPLCAVYKFVQTHPLLDILPRDEYVFLNRFVRCFKFSHWSMEYLNNNILKYVVKLVRRHVDTVLQPMRKYLSVEKSQPQTIDYERHNAKLKEQAVIVNVLFKLAESGFLENCSENQAIGGRLSEFTAANKHFGSIATELQNGTYDWTKFPALLQDALNRYTRRSAAFKDAKQDMLTTFSEGGPKWDEKIKQYEQMIAQLKQRAAVPGHEPEVKVQNAKAIDPSDSKRLREDSERAQGVPWSISKEAPDMAQINSDIEYVMTGERKAPVVDEVADQLETSLQISGQPSDAVVSKVTDTDPEYVKVLTRLGDAKPVQKVVDFARSLDAVEVAQMQFADVSMQHFYELLSFIGYGTEAEVSAVIRQMLLTCVTHWKLGADQVEAKIYDELKSKLPKCEQVQESRMRVE